MFGLAGTPAMAGVSDHTMGKDEYKAYIKTTQAQVDSLKHNRPIVILDRGQAKGSTAYITSTMARILSKKGQDLHAFNIVFSLRANAPKTTGYAWRINNNKKAKYPDLGIVLPMHPKTTARAKLASYADLPSGVHFREDFPVTTQQSALFTTWHEAFGHCTEGPDLLGPKVPYTDYIRHLREVRSDIAASICLAQMDGHTRTARTISMVRDLGMNHTFTGFFSSVFSPTQACIYNLGPTSRMACDEIDRILANPVKAKAFRALDSDGLVALVNQIFDKVKPTQEAYKYNSTLLRDAILMQENQALQDTMRQDPHRYLEAQLVIRRMQHAKTALLEPEQKTGHAAPTPKPAFL